MGSWDEILDEVNGMESSQDYIRHKYISSLSDLTGRNTITYYSGWLGKPNAYNVDINDNDMNGIMNCVHGLDCSKGLDLILHTPGGSPAAAEAIVYYLRNKFSNDIRVIVPQLAMSAGTMIACSAKTIIMGIQSSLGPIDPQFDGIPAYNIKSEFEEAKQDLLDNPDNVRYWGIKLQQYPAAFMKSAIDAIEISGKLVYEWLGSCMFDNSIETDRKIVSNIVSKLNEHENSKIHNRHYNSEFCKSIGLKIEMMEESDSLQDAILSLHHAYMITFSCTKAVKIIENNKGKSAIAFAK